MEKLRATLLSYMDEKIEILNNKIDKVAISWKNDEISTAEYRMKSDCLNLMLQNVAVKSEILKLKLYEN